MGGNNLLTAVQSSINKINIKLANYIKSINNIKNNMITSDNIKTLNGLSLVGEGNIVIKGGDYGEDNVIDTIKVNNTVLPVSNKTVNISVPTKAEDVNALSDSISHLAGDVPITRTINGKSLNSDISIGLSDLTDLNGDAKHRLVYDSSISLWNNKQSTLVSGVNIKTINNNSILGNGNINISTGDSSIYDNTESGLTATTYLTAIDELASLIKSNESLTYTYTNGILQITL